MKTALGLGVVGDDSAGHMEKLVRWLRDEPELRGLVAVSRPLPGPGDMGSVTELITVAVAGGGVLSVLASSLRTWLAQPRRSDVEIEISHPDGRRIVISAKRIDDVPALVNSMLDSQRRD